MRPEISSSIFNPGYMGCRDPNNLPFGPVPNVFVTRNWNGPSFWLMYATAVASIIQFQQHMQSGFIFAEAFKQKKAACNLRGNLCCIYFPYNSIYLQFLLSLELFCASSSTFQTCIRKSCKIERWKFDGCKSIKNFFLSTTVIHLLLPLRYKLSDKIATR